MHQIHSLAALQVSSRPYSLRVVLKNLLRHEGDRVRAEQVQLLLDWDDGPDHGRAIDISPSRSSLHDTNGVRPS